MRENKADKKSLGKYGEYKVFSTFCGCGGLDLGFEKAGFTIVGANEVDSNACRSYKLRFPKVNLIEKDIRLVPNKQFPKNIDVLIGGYPCQGFSELSHQRLDDERNFLYREFGRVLTATQPKMFLAENVRGLVNMANGKVIKQMVKEFEEKGYQVQYKLLDAKDYGVPQTRTRVFIIGIRSDLDLEFNYPAKTHGFRLQPYKTLRETIWKFREHPGVHYEGDAERPFLKDGYSDDFKSRQRKLTWDSPSAPIIATMWNIPLHPDGKPMKRVGNRKYEFDGKTNRTLSIKEVVAIQSFPDDFEVKGRLIDQYRQVGNAVPFLLAKILALSMKKSLDGIKICQCAYCNKNKEVKEIIFIDTNRELSNLYACKDCYQTQLNSSWVAHDPAKVLIKS